MPVRYIDVRSVSQLFVAATRAYGDIALIGPCAAAATAAVNQPLRFSDPTAAEGPLAGPLADAIEIAFRQTPGPTTVWGVRVDDATPDWDTALDAVALLDVQIVACAGVAAAAADQTAIAALSSHVTTVSNTGPDGRERIGIAMLPRDSADPADIAGLENDRMFYVAHRSTEDAGAAVAGVIAGQQPHVSLLLKRVAIEMRETFSVTEIDTLDAAGVNWLTDPVLFPGRGIYLGEGYSGDIGGTRRYIDIVRTMDQVSFDVKAALIQAIGRFRITRAGLRSLVTIVQSVLTPLQAREVIDGYVVYIPLLVLLDKEPGSRSDEEGQQIDAAQANRRVDMVITVDYAGAIHRLRIDLVFT